MWKKAMDYLGLGPDDAYEDYDPSAEQVNPSRSQRSGRDTGSQRAVRSVDDPDDGVRPMPTRPSFPSRDPDPMGRRDDSTVNPRPLNQPRQSSATRVIPGGEPYTVKPRRFDSAQELADKFKEGQPVIMNLEAADREVSRRLIDFASGLCYALNGSMEKVATGVYLLKPVPRGYDA